jgi:hypothetical protein
MNKLYILEQKISTLEIIIESLVEELIESELVNQKRLDDRIVDKIKLLSEELKHDKIQLIDDDEDFELSINGIPFFGKKGEA